MVSRDVKPRAAALRNALIIAALSTVGAGLVLARIGRPQADAHQKSGDPRSPLQDLRSLDELREAFNHDNGKIRLLLLLSPT